MKIRNIVLLILIVFSASTVGAYYFTASNVTYSNSNIKATNTQQAIEAIYNKACPSNAICEWKKSWSNVEVGDYVSMTPTKKSYSVDLTKTGMSNYNGWDSAMSDIKNNGQTINPSELKLWRVIRKNTNGTIDLVSEYVSSVAVYFYGATGYANYVGYLNTLASQYANTNYTTSTRYMGYNGQTQIITNTTAFNGSSTTVPWTSSTTSTANQKPSNEAQGGGDTLYTTDTDLVKIALGTLAANKVGTTAPTTYWVASRYYYYSSSTYCSFYVHTDTSSQQLRYYGSSWYDMYNRYALRPIITLKSGLSISDAPGTKENPFVLP